MDHTQRDTVHFLILKKKNVHFYFLFSDVSPPCVFIYHVFTAYGRQKKEPNTLVLKRQTIICCPIHAGNVTKVVYKSVKCL